MLKVINLDLRPSSLLKWEEGKHLAQEWMNEGHQLVWDLELGLFEDLSMPIADAGQFLSLELALEHFKTHFFPQFESHSVGAILYKGSFLFSEKFAWHADEKEAFQEWLGNELETPFKKALFCRDYCMDFIRLLMLKLPEKITPFLLFKERPLAAEHYYMLTSQESYEHFSIAFWGKMSPLAKGLAAYHLEGDTLFAPEQPLPPLAFCLPIQQASEESWKKIGRAIEKCEEPFRVIPELMLTQLWEGVETLVVCRQALTVQGNRKLQGFMAAGGQVTLID